MLIRFPPARDLRRVRETQKSTARNWLLDYSRASNRNVRRSTNIETVESANGT